MSPAETLAAYRTSPENVTRKSLEHALAELGASTSGANKAALAARLGEALTETGPPSAASRAPAELLAAYRASPESVSMEDLAAALLALGEPTAAPSKEARAARLEAALNSLEAEAPQNNLEHDTPPVGTPEESGLPQGMASADPAADPHAGPPPVLEGEIADADATPESSSAPAQPAAPITEAQPEPVAEAQLAAPITEAQPEPVAEAQPEPVAEAQPEPVADLAGAARPRKGRADRTAADVVAPPGAMRPTSAPPTLPPGAARQNTVGASASAATAPPPTHARRAPLAARPAPQARLPMGAARLRAPAVARPDTSVRGTRPMPEAGTPSHQDKLEALKTAAYEAIPALEGELKALAAQLFAELTRS